MKAALPLAAGRLYQVLLHYRPRAASVAAELSGDDGVTVPLAAPHPPAGPLPAALLLGRDRFGHRSYPLWSAAFSDLRVTSGR
jgi:hypothetical protein